MREQRSGPIPNGWIFRLILAIEDKGQQTVYFVMIKPGASVEVLALVNLYKDYSDMTKDHGDEGGPEPRFVVVTKYIPPRLSELAREVGAFILTVPKEVKLTEHADKTIQTPMRITTEKS